MEHRDYRIDGIKYFLIILVIIGHYIEPSRYNVKASSDLYSLIFFFHMPLFVMISGYFCENLSKTKIKKFILKIIEIIGVFLFVDSIIRPPSSFISLFSFSNGLWFLLCLVYWKLYAFALDYLDINLKKQVVISFALGLIGFIFINRYESLFACQRALQFLPYFSIGRYLKRYPPKSISNKAFYIFIISLGVLLVLLSSRELHVFEFQRNGLFSLAQQTHYSILTCFLGKIMLWITSILVGILLLEKCKFPTLFEMYGSETLSVFVLQCYSRPIANRLVSSFTLEIIIALLSVFVFTIIAHNRSLSSFITNPISSIITFRKDH